MSKKECDADPMFGAAILDELLQPYLEELKWIQNGSEQSMSLTADVIHFSIRHLD